MKTILAYPHNHKENREMYTIVGWENDWDKDPGLVRLTSVLSNGYEI